MTKNELEIALSRAATDPASRPDFYRVLLAAEIFVIGTGDNSKQGRSIIPVGTNISIVQWRKSDGTFVTPFFSSLETLQDGVKEEVRFIRLPARRFFELVTGQTLVLNPASTGKEFFPHEVAALLASGVNHVPVQRVVQESTEIFLGRPKNYPNKMVSALSAFLPRHDNVQAAYLCLMHEVSANSTPSLVVGLKAVGDIDAAIKEAAAIAADCAQPGTPVDFLEIREGRAGVDEYMLNSVEPFYKR